MGYGQHRKKILSPGIGGGTGAGGGFNALTRIGKDFNAGQFPSGSQLAEIARNPQNPWANPFATGKNAIAGGGAVTGATSPLFSGGSTAVSDVASGIVADANAGLSQAINTVANATPTGTTATGSNALATSANYAPALGLAVGLGGLATIANQIKKDSQVTVGDYYNWYAPFETRQFDTKDEFLNWYNDYGDYYKRQGAFTSGLANALGASSMSDKPLADAVAMLNKYTSHRAKETGSELLERGKNESYEDWARRNLQDRLDYLKKQDPYYSKWYPQINDLTLDDILSRSGGLTMSTPESLYYLPKMTVDRDDPRAGQMVAAKYGQEISDWRDTLAEMNQSTVAGYVPDNAINNLSSTELNYLAKNPELARLIYG